MDFVDRDHRCCATIKENLEKTKLASQAHVYCTEVIRAVSLLSKEYDIILIDPPYADESIGKYLEQLAASKLVGPKTVVVVTHSARLQFETNYSSLSLIKERRHGDSCIAIYQKGRDS